MSFPDEWKRIAEKELKGDPIALVRKAPEGLEVKPVYTASNLGCVLIKQLAPDVRSTLTAAGKRTSPEVAEGPAADQCVAQKSMLLDDVGCQNHHCNWNLNAKCRIGSHVDDDVEASRQLA